MMNDEWRVSRKGERLMTWLSFLKSPAESDAILDVSQVTIHFSNFTLHTSNFT